ncbi:MAG: glycoside hydrolase family 31 protein [Candidatus Hydrogenedentota bacterium]
MDLIRFDAVSVIDRVAHLSSSRFQARIHARADGIWRVLVWHRIEDTDKGSWTVSADDLANLLLKEDAAGWRLSADGADDLCISLAPFTITVGEFASTGLTAQRWKELPRRKDLPNNAPSWDPVGETNDGLPLGCGLTMEIAEPAGRSYFGLGERTGFLDKKGKTWTNWNTDPASRHSENMDPLYQSHPFVMALDNGKSFGLYLDETWRTVFDLGSTHADRSSFHTDGPTFDLYLIPGPDPLDVLRRYAALVGRPPMPPLWALGYHQCRWSYPTDTTIRAIAREYRRRGIPLDALWLDIDYMDAYKVFTFSPTRFPDPEKLLRELKEDGIRTVAIVDPGVKKEAGYEVYENGHVLDMFVRNSRDEELEGEVWPGKTAFPDFTKEKVRGWWGGLHRLYLDVGLDGIWNDMNEPAVFQSPGHTLPTNSRHGERYHAEVHNIYGYLMSRSTFEALSAFRLERRPFVLTRAGFAGIQKYAWVWTGDNASAWEHLEMSIPMILNLGISAVPFSGADVGGFGEHCDGELLARWTWLGAFYPFMRNHAGKGSRRQEPWEFGSRHEDVVRDAIRFRYRLLPFFYTLAEEATRTGWPLLRPLFLHYPDDPKTYTMHDQFLLGRDLLVAPVTRPGQVERMVYLPLGTWFDFWTGHRYDGGCSIIAAAPLERIPLFVRGGACIPMTASADHTSTARWDPLEWVVAPQETFEGSVFEDEGDGNMPGSRRTLRGRIEDSTMTIETTGALPVKVILLGSKPPEVSDAQISERGSEIILTKPASSWKA